MAEKGRSPFYPGQPVPVELFSGRHDSTRRLEERGLVQTKLGKPTVFFVDGEYGIGKSSIAGFSQFIGEAKHKLHPIYVSLGGAKQIEDVTVRIVEGILKSEPKDDFLKEFLGKYIESVSVFGIQVNLSKLKQDAGQFSSPTGVLNLLNRTFGELRKDGRECSGLFIVLDEINGIASNADFSHFIKGVVDTNALAERPLPLMLMLCGTEDRRREMIACHPPVERIFDIIRVEPMPEKDAADFFLKAFGEAKMEVEPNALALLVTHSAGFPRLMHLLGDMAYWADTDGHLSVQDALHSTIAAAEELGTKYIDSDIMQALRSEDYKGILKKIAKISPYEMKLTREGIAKGLSESEKKKLDNFLTRMKKLNVLRSGDIMGEYEFNSRLERLYFWLRYTTKES